jgi:hypothetical protein
LFVRSDGSISGQLAEHLLDELGEP